LKKEKNNIIDNQLSNDEIKKIIEENDNPFSKAKDFDEFQRITKEYNKLYPQEEKKDYKIFYLLSTAITIGLLLIGFVFDNNEIIVSNITLKILGEYLLPLGILIIIFLTILKKEISNKFENNFIEGVLFFSMKLIIAGIIFIFGISTSMVGYSILSLSIFSVVSVMLYGLNNKAGSISGVVIVPLILLSIIGLFLILL